jgi:hypothetical protein
MKTQLYAFVLGVVGPAAIAFALIANKEEAPQTNEEVLTEILAEIDRGEWADHVEEEETRPTEAEIAKGVEKAILDTLMKEYGFRFDVKDLQVFHIYEDKYRGFLHTNKVSLYHNMYSFWFDSNGAYFFIENWTEEYVNYDDDPFGEE